SRRELKIEEHWFQQGRLVLKFAGVDSIDEAEALRNVDVCVAESDAIELAEGEYFDWQLEGCEVETVDGKKVGKVTELMRPGGAEILVVGVDKEFLIPFATSICVDVDVEAKKIVVDPPEGLLDF
ncbi:MAG TPA: ribosome maturation factor RimM, partial [Pyrinomonadaceae bacterium]